MELLKKLEIEYDNLKLYETALTHTSYANENNVESYERLEFLGDAVLQLIITDYLYETTDLLEGAMTKKRASYVCEDSLNNVGLKLEINEYIRLGRGEEESGGRTKKAIVADVVESFLGALFLEKNFETVKRFIYKTIIPIIESEEPMLNDYKSTLQELVQTDRRSLEYELISEEGPAHNKSYTVVVKINNIVYGKGTSSSKKGAEQAAAHDALKKSVK